MHELSEQEFIEETVKRNPQGESEGRCPEDRVQWVSKEPAHVVQVWRLCKRFLQDQFDGEKM